MKIYLVILSLIFIACSNPKDTQTEEKVSSPASTPNVPSSNVQKLLRSIMGTGEGLLRGIKFGDAISDVKKKETVELFEEEETHIGYSFDTESLETVDILYEKDQKNHVSGIELDIYMNSDASNDSLKNELINQFTIRYGKPLSDIDIPTWKIKPNGQVNIKVVKNKLDRGLEVRFSQLPKSI
ncbi:hypothetical protein [Emticicia sp.]|uniref:hypothetical protein n=1 Tax=Emticicia sp. TaxID=1930953 RepID=UPI0037539680